MNKYDLMLIDAPPNKLIEFKGFERKENYQKIFSNVGLGYYKFDENLRPKNGFYIHGDIPYKGKLSDFFNKNDLREIDANNY